MVALVTGANRGLGEVYARELVARGAAKVYGAARNPAAVTEPGVRPVALDITDPDRVARVAAQCADVTLLAMIFAVAMTFIDQTIVSIAAPTIQHNLGLSSSGMQWAINAYLLAMAALFAFGGRLADTAGHRKMVVLGVIIFAGASALCGLTPRGGWGYEATRASVSGPMPASLAVRSAVSPYRAPSAAGAT